VLADGDKLAQKDLLPKLRDACDPAEHLNDH
jgi:hypothetical protein